MLGRPSQLGHSGATGGGAGANLFGVSATFQTRPEALPARGRTKPKLGRRHPARCFAFMVAPTWRLSRHFSAQFGDVRFDSLHCKLGIRIPKVEEAPAMRWAHQTSKCSFEQHQNKLLVALQFVIWWPTRAPGSHSGLQVPQGLSISRSNCESESITFTSFKHTHSPWWLWPSSKWPFSGRPLCGSHHFQRRLPLLISPPEGNQKSARVTSDGGRCVQFAWAQPHSCGRLGGARWLAFLTDDLNFIWRWGPPSQAPLWQPVGCSCWPCSLRGPRQRGEIPAHQRSAR